MLKSEYSTFDRRMEILSILMNQRLVSCLELSRRFHISEDTISRYITALSRFAPIASKKGRYGGVYIIDTYYKYKRELYNEKVVLSASE